MTTRFNRSAIWLLCIATALAATASTSVAAPSKTAQNRAVRERVHEIGLRKAAVDPAFARRHQSSYSVQVPKTPIRDQEHSGRCWTFAWIKTLETMAKAQGAQPDSLSAAFINYHALRTLAHAAIDQGVRNAAHPEHNLYYLDGNMLGEGGYSHWANDIVKKHGIVPEEKLRSTTFDSRWSDIMQNQLHRLVSAAYRDLDHTSKGAVAKRRAIARKYKQQVDQALDTMIGAPPRRFTIHGKTYTPRTYLRDYLKLAEKDLQFVNLTNDPNRAFNRRYREVYPRGVPENETINVSIDVMQRAVRKTVRAGVAPNVAVNVDWDNPHRVANRHDDSTPQNGILSISAFKYEKLVPTVKLSKRDRLTHNVSLSNHMMAITGYEPAKPGKQARYQIDNSHGKGSFRQGRFDMYDDFFRQYVEELTVPVSALPKSLRKKSTIAAAAIDVIDGMSIPPSKGGERWTPTRKRMLVKALIREELSFADAAQRYNLPVETVRGWYQQAKKAMLRTFATAK